MFNSTKKWIRAHKFASAVIAILVLYAGYYVYKTIYPTTIVARYVSVKAAKGTIVSSISGGGQVAVSNQIDIKSKVSGQIINLPITEGREVAAGILIIQLDTTNARKAVRDAEASLESAQINFDKFNGLNDALIPKAAQDAADNLKKDYDDGFNTVSNVFLDLPTIISGLNSALYGNDFTSNQSNVDFYKNTIEKYDSLSADANAAITDAAYKKARTAYDKNFADYKAISRSSSPADIENLISETYITVQDMSDSIKDTYNFIQLYKDLLTTHNLKISSVADTEISSLNAYTGKINTHLSNLLNIEYAIKSDKDAVTNAGLDLKSQKLALEKAKNALQDAKDALPDYLIRAPFAGVIVNVTAKNGDNISQGAVLATLITKQKIAQTSLNEVDAAKIKIGQKATLTFDAVPNLTITGEVAEINTLGTVTQGVVTYQVKIVFDTQDERVKPGMSFTAMIITDLKQNVLIVPNSALKSQGSTDAKYVQVLINGVPQTKTVETGLSNDTSTEIISGIVEGDNVITQTITGSPTTGTTQTTGGIRIPGLGGGGGFRGGGG